MLAVCTALCLALAALDAGAENGPQLTCDQPIHNFGSLVNTQIVSYTFLLHNSGGATAVISRIETSCACTTTHPGWMRIPPGEDEPLEALLDLRGLNGPQRSPIAITWNDRNGAPLRLEFIGTAVALVASDPATVSFGTVPLAGTAERVVRIYSPFSNVSFHVTSASCTNEPFTVAAETVNPGREYRVRITAAPRKPGRFSAVLTVATDRPGYAALSIPIDSFVPAP
jgi:hypothetical protein